MLKPLADRVILKVQEEEKTVGSFVVAGASTEQPNQASVIAVGPGKIKHGQLVEPTVKVGDKVVFDRFAGTEVKDQGESYLIVREKDILAIVE